MKHILEFTLPEEREELELTMKAGDMSLVLHEFYNRVLRGNIKHGLSQALMERCGVTEGSEGAEIVDKTLEFINEQFWTIVNEYDVKV